MSFSAKLKLDGEEMVVLKLQFKLTQDTDVTGKVTADPMGGWIKLTVESTKSTLLFDWMKGTKTTKDGVITFFQKGAADKKMREFRFSEAYCISYDENFVAYDDNPMEIEIVFSAKKIDLNGSKFNKNWQLSMN